jgi:branched-chain amino acid transport system substrate-binding protein
MLKYATAAVGITGLAGCSSNDSSGDGSGDGGDGGSIVFGEPTMETSQFGFIMPGTNQSIDLAIEEINDAGGLLGSTVEVSRRETGSDPTEFREVFEQFVNNDDAVGIIRATSAELTPNLEFVAERETPLITNGAGTTALDDYGGDNGTPEDMSDDEWVWRTIASDSVSTAGGAKYMYDQGYERMAILAGNSQGERSWADSFAAAYENLGGEIVNQLEVQNGKNSYQSELSRLFEADFDAWGLSLKRDDATTLVREWNNAGYGGQMIAESGIRSDEFVDAVGEQAEGALISFTATSGPNYGEFEEKYREFGDAELHQWALAGYDAMTVAALAAQQGGEASPEVIQQNLAAVSEPPGAAVSSFPEGKEALENDEEINYEGVLTPTDFTDDGNVVGDVRVAQLTPDGFEDEALVSADEIRDLFTS